MATSTKYLTLFSFCINFALHSEITWKSLHYLCFLPLCYWLHFISNRKEWTQDCRYTHGLARTLIFTAFAWVISTISTCALNNSHSDTVGYGLPDLLSPSGSWSCVGFLFYDFLFSSSSSYLWNVKGEHRCPCRLYRLCWWTRVRLGRCCCF